MFETTNQNRFCLFNGTLHSSLPKNPMWTKQNTRPKHMMKWLAASIHPEPHSLHLTVAMNLCIHRIQLSFKIPYVIPYETQTFTQRIHPFIFLKPTDVRPTWALSPLLYTMCDVCTIMPARSHAICDASVPELAAPGAKSSAERSGGARLAIASGVTRAAAMSLDADSLCWGGWPVGVAADSGVLCELPPVFPRDRRGGRASL